MRKRVEECFCQYQHDTVISDLKLGGLKKKKRKMFHSSMRNVEWSHQGSYDLIRAGIPIINQDAIRNLVDTQTLTEGHLFIFKHKDANVQRNAIVPMFEAVYWCNDEKKWFLVQKSHLKIAYRNAKKTTRSQMWSIGSGEPYWVDRYAFSVQKVMDSQRRK